MASKIIDKAKSALGRDNELKLAGRPVGSTGYGLMGLTWRANPPPLDQSFAAMKAALADGANFWNGGEIYGSAARNSLHLLREYFAAHPGDAARVVLSIKGGCKPGELVPDGSAGNTERSIEECLRVLDGSKKLDVWEAARVDPHTPIEVTMREADKFVRSGQLGGISLSECSAATIRRAAAVTTIAAVEVEFSLWETSILTNGVAAACAELDIPVIAYSPLGRGFLTGQITKPEDIPEGDMRRHYPRFQGENFYTNIKLVHELQTLATRKGCSSGQLAIAWIKAQSGKPGLPTIIPIPGATTEARVHENSADIELSENDVKEIDSLLATFEILGGRYPAPGSTHLFGDSPKE